MAFTTIEKWEAYAEARGALAPSSADTTQLAEQALQRAVDYITRHYVNLFVSPYNTTPFTGAVADALETATNIAATRELEVPNRYSIVINPAEDREIIQAGEIKYRPSTHSNNAERVVDLVARDSDVHLLLDRFTIPSGRAGGFVLAAIAGCR